MPIVPRPLIEQKFADEDTPFDVTLAVAATAEDLITPPTGKKGRTISLVNEGVGAVAIAFDGTAVVTDLRLEEGDAYDEHNLEVSTNVSFINIDTGETPTVRGVLWSGPE